MNVFILVHKIQLHVYYGVLADHYYWWEGIILIIDKYNQTSGLKGLKYQRFIKSLTIYNR